MLPEKLTEDIIGAAMLVLNKLRPGMDEKLYERGLVLELVKHGHKVEQQRAYPVFYDGVEIGTWVPDLIVDDAVIADPKVVTDFADTHVAQMLGYLNITGLQVSLLLTSSIRNCVGNVLSARFLHPGHPCNPWFNLL